MEHSTHTDAILVPSYIKLAQISDRLNTNGMGLHRSQY